MITLNKQLIVAFTIVLSGFVIQSCSDSTGLGDESNKTFSYTENPGNSAHAFLSNDSFTNLEIEIDYMSGQKPANASLDSLKAFLQERLHKTRIRFSAISEIPSGGQDSYSVDEAYDLEKKHRDNYKTNQETLSAYFIIVDGSDSDDESVLGAAYFNTSIAIFGKKIQEISSGLGSPSIEKIEATVFDHEFGHLMGLVGNGSPTQSDHKTKDSPHCTTKSCLMNPVVQTSNFFNNTFDNSIMDLDSLCIKDLQANGGK